MTRALSTACLFAIASLAPADGPTPPAGYVVELSKLQAAARERKEKTYAEFGRRLGEAKTDADREAAQRWAKRALEENAKADGLAQEHLMKLLRRSADDPAAARGLAYLAHAESDALRTEAVALLRRHHLGHPDTIVLAENTWHVPHAWVEPLLRDLLAARTTPDDRRPRLKFALAMHLKLLAELPARIAGDPHQMGERYGKGRAAELRKADVAKLEAEAVELFEDLAEAGGRVELAGGLSVADVSRSAAHEIRNLGVGKRAPDIDGEDLNGVRFKLSDHKGQVVLLSFWGSWCSPCMALVPHEREIAARFAGRPFALVGVCSDEDRGQVKPVLERHKITWRSFWCGPKGGLGELPRAWNVTAWPTVYVIDHTGVIRSKTARGAELDRLLDGLVKEAEAGTPE